MGGGVRGKVGDRDTSNLHININIQYWTSHRQD